MTARENDMADGNRVVYDDDPEELSMGELRKRLVRIHPRDVFAACISPEDWAAMISKEVEAARDGNLHAFELLLEYAFGKPISIDSQPGWSDFPNLPSYERRPGPRPRPAGPDETPETERASHERAG